MKNAKIALVLALGLGLAGCGGNGGGEDSGPENPVTVRKASCGSNDKPETGLQGQVPASLRTAGGAFKGFNCNLELVGQSKNDGASWVAPKFGNCMYYDTSFQTANRTQLGAVVIDNTNPAAPRPTMFLTTEAMLDPWESLKVNERRQLLGAVDSRNGNGGPAIDLYDLSANCATPQLLASKRVGEVGTEDPLKVAVRGHEGEFAPDGLTYYGSSLGGRYIYAIDITSTRNPKLISKWDNPNPVGIHGHELTPDGNRLYATSFGQGGANPARVGGANNGLIILDTSDVQKRVANPVMKVVSTFFWDDGSGAQHTIPIKIQGKSYLVFVDEGGSGAGNDVGRKAACDAKMAPWPMARILDISDEKNPKLASRLALEIHDGAKCSQALPDVAGLGGFTYGSHYCAVDDKNETTAVACGYFESGIRVFDVRDPLRPKEIAYFNPPSVATPSPGSQNNRTAANGRADHCSAPVHFDKAKAMLYTTCQDNGFLTLKFTNGAWPFR
jgi:hypothetical protein